jgi:hypothetical protein
MTSKYILEEVTLVENNFSADSRNKDGVRIVSYESRRSINVHLAIRHIVEIELVKDAKGDSDRAIVTLMNGHRYISRRSATELCAAIEAAA